MIKYVVYDILRESVSMMSILVIVIASCMFVINGITSKSINRCKNGGNFTSVNLTCFNNDIIHVENIKYFYNGSSDCIGSAGICGQPLTNSDTGLISSCTGQPSPCRQYIPNYSNCTGSTVNYRCIPRRNDQDMCQSPLTLNEIVNRTYLFSPNYPDFATGFKRNEPSCQCDIRGTSITSITVLDLILPTGSKGVRSNLFIQYGDVTYNKTSREKSQSILPVYNHRLQSTPPPTSAVIIFNHQQINRQKLWIEIQGISLARSCNNILATHTTPFISSPSHLQPGGTTVTDPSSTSTANSTENNTTEASNVNSNTTTDYSISSEPSTETQEISFNTRTETSQISSGLTSITTINPSDSAAQQTDNDLSVIAGCVVGGLVFIFVLVAVCVLVRIRRKKADALQQNVHAQVNNTTNNTVNNTTPNYFVLESLNTQDEEVKHDDISTNPSRTTTGCTPEYAVVNKTKRELTVADVNSPDQATKSNATGVADMEILENELYIPYEASNNPDNTGMVASTTNSTTQPRPSGDMEILENELYIPYEASSNPDDTGVVTSTINNTTQHRPLRDMEIMENDLYVPFENSAVDVSKRMANSVYDNAAECGTQQNVTAPEMEIGTKQNVATPEMEILDTDLCVPFEDTDNAVYDNAYKSETKPSDHAPIMEILENDLYVPFEETQV